MLVNSFIFHVVSEDITVVIFNKSKGAVEIINNLFIEIMMKYQENKSDYGGHRK